MGRECPIEDIKDLNNQPYRAVPADPNLSVFEFDEIYHVDPVTGCGQYMLSRAEQHADKKFGLGLLVCVSAAASWCLCTLQAD
jgi:hypothetical protein